MGQQSLCEMKVWGKTTGVVRVKWEGVWKDKGQEEVETEG